MTCQYCGTDAAPYSQARIGHGGVVAMWRCAVCHEVVPSPEEEQDHEPKPAPAIAPTQDRPVQTVTDEPLDVIKAAKARVRWLRKELKRLGSLQAELDKLSRLLDAAGSTRAPRAPKG